MAKLIFNDKKLFKIFASYSFSTKSHFEWPKFCHFKIAFTFHKQSHYEWALLKSDTEILSDWFLLMYMVCFLNRYFTDRHGYGGAIYDAHGPDRHRQNGSAADENVRGSGYWYDWRHRTHRHQGYIHTSNQGNLWNYFKNVFLHARTVNNYKKEFQLKAAIGGLPTVPWVAIGGS